MILAKKKIQQLLITFFVLLSISNITVVFADAKGDYINAGREGIGRITDTARRESLTSLFDAIVTCLNASTGSIPNWEFPNTAPASRIELSARLAVYENHPCSNARVQFFDARGWFPVVDQYAVDMFQYIASLITVESDRAPALQAAVSSVVCLNTESSSGRPNYFFPDSEPTDSADLQGRLNQDNHPCHSQHSNIFVTIRAPSPGATSGSEPLSTDVSGGGAPTSGIAPGTIYTGPGFVNVTPFSTFGRISIDRIINNAINYISGFLAIIAVLSIMYGGILYMTARGDDAQVGKAKQVITLTVVGLVIASFAYLIIIFVTRIFYGG